MKMPRILKGFNLFVDGENQYGIVVDVTRPKIARKTEDYTPGGAMGEMTIVHGFEKLELEITSKGYDADMLRSMSSSINGKLIRYQGALQQEDGGEYQELKGEARRPRQRQAGRGWRAQIQNRACLLERDPRRTRDFGIRLFSQQGQLWRQRRTRRPAQSTRHDVTKKAA